MRVARRTYFYAKIAAEDKIYSKSILNKYDTPAIRIEG